MQETNPRFHLIWDATGVLLVKLPADLFSEEPLEEIYHIVSWADSKNGTRRNYSIRRRDGADPKDFATVYAERKNETCEWQWSCFRSWGRLTATVSICMAREWQEARDGQKEPT